jgi:glycosyltransferase involved in cell wall biosynthesis
VPHGDPIPIAIVLTSFDAGGTERQMSELIARIDSNRFDVRAVCLKRRGAFLPLVERSAPISEFDFDGFVSRGAFAQMVRFARWCRDGGIQVVHACDFYSNVFALPAAALARVPVRIGSRRDLFIPERRPAQERAQRLAYEFAHVVVANSEAAAQWLRREGVPSRKIRHIPNGLHIRQRVGRANRTGVITTVANLRPGKGHEILLEAAACVVQRHPGVRFQIVGDGPRREELERRAVALGIAPHVTFLGHRDDVADILEGSEIFAFPSFMEAAPNALLEAMAAHLPVVATRVGGIPEVLADEHNGLLVPPRDPRALADAILRLVRDPPLAARLAEAAWQTVVSRFSFDRMTRSFQDLYMQELFARSAARRAVSAA